VGVRPGALLDDLQVGEQAIGERPTSTRLHVSARPRRHATKPSGTRETQFDKNTTARSRANTTCPLMRISGAHCALERTHENARLCPGTRGPRQCGEVALPERAINRGPEGYHPQPTRQAENPATTGDPATPQGTSSPQSGRRRRPRKSARSGRRHADEAPLAALEPPSTPGALHHAPEGLP
jgi:hypothetical protein